MCPGRGWGFLHCEGGNRARRSLVPARLDLKPGVDGAGEGEAGFGFVFSRTNSFVILFLIFTYKNRAHT